MTRQRLCEEIAQYDLLVTFNGTSFDLPVLLASIQGLPLDQPHVDLCLLGRQLGYRGGLKAIEHQLGIRRRADLCGMSGADAGQLWNRWRHSRDEKHGDGPWPITRQTVSTYNHWQICSIAESFDSVEVMMPHPATRPTVWRLAHPLTGMESPHVTTRAGEEEG